MASPQTENGHLKIADDLVTAFFKGDFTAVQLRVLLCILQMTYRVGKTKAAITVEDLRYATGMKKYKIDTALEPLIANNVIFVQSELVIGLQKDWETWGKYAWKSPTQPDTASIKMPKSGSPMDRLVQHYHKKLVLEVNYFQWNKERQAAVDIYTYALSRVHNPQEALAAIDDYFESLRDKLLAVHLPFCYMKPGFSRWLGAIPQKPKGVREDEEFLGIRHRWNPRSKSWEATGPRIKP